mmetsp:Transcript_99072/g.296008  ORF Transcript_99072/g.296008 Transcript_99072/m.296008 type:complete len:224 (-) Transcript_99072:700-1371(-)
MWPSAPGRSSLPRLPASRRVVATKACTGRAARSSGWTRFASSGGRLCSWSTSASGASSGTSPSRAPCWGWCSRWPTALPCGGSPTGVWLLSSPACCGPAFPWRRRPWASWRRCSWSETWEPCRTTANCRLHSRCCSLPCRRPRSRSTCCGECEKIQTAPPLPSTSSQACLQSSSYSMPCFGERPRTGSQARPYSYWGWCSCSSRCSSSSSQGCGGRWSWSLGC